MGVWFACFLNAVLGLRFKFPCYPYVSGNISEYTREPCRGHLFRWISDVPHFLSFLLSCFPFPPPRGPSLGHVTCWLLPQLSTHGTSLLLSLPCFKHIPSIALDPVPKHSRSLRYYGLGLQPRDLAGTQFSLEFETMCCSRVNCILFWKELSKTYTSYTFFSQFLGKFFWGVFFRLFRLFIVENFCYLFVLPHTHSSPLPPFSFLFIV